MTELPTIGEALDAAARAHATRRGWACGGEETTVAEMRGRTRRLASGLLSLGIGRGDRIALNAPNLTAWVEVYLAAASIGAVFVGLNVRYRSSELAHILERSGASAVMTVPELGDTDYVKLIGGLGIESLQHLVTIGAGGDLTLDELRAHEPDEAPAHCCRERAVTRRSRHDHLHVGDDRAAERRHADTPLAARRRPGAGRALPHGCGRRAAGRAPAQPRRKRKRALK
jgi:acyl-CoA synthetase (AMP-forming)/AMP-acid ligase II